MPNSCRVLATTLSCPPHRFTTLGLYPLEALASARAHSGEEHLSHIRLDSITVRTQHSASAFHKNGCEPVNDARIRARVHMLRRAKIPLANRVDDNSLLVVDNFEFTTLLS